MNLSTVKWAQWDKTQSREVLGLFLCVCIALCIVAHNIAHNRLDNFSPYPPVNHHCSDDVYLREGGIILQNFLCFVFLLTRSYNCIFAILYCVTSTLHPFNGLFSRTTSVSRHQKGKPFWILLEQEMMGWQWHQLDHMQIICTSLQTDNHASTSPLSFYRPDALHAAQPTASKHCTALVEQFITLLMDRLSSDVFMSLSIVLLCLSTWVTGCFAVATGLWQLASCRITLHTANSLIMSGRTIHCTLSMPCKCICTYAIVCAICDMVLLKSQRTFAE